MRISVDDRRLAWFDILPEGCTESAGSLNVISLYPGATSAWHKHQQQDDYFFCVAGAVKIGEYHEDDNTWTVLDERDPGPLCVPRGRWHGYAHVAGERAILLMYASKKYNEEEPDEERMRTDGSEWKRIIR